MDNMFTYDNSTSEQHEATPTTAAEHPSQYFGIADRLREPLLDALDPRTSVNGHNDIQHHDSSTAPLFRHWNLQHSQLTASRQRTVPNGLRIPGRTSSLGQEKSQTSNVADHAKPEGDLIDFTEPPSPRRDSVLSATWDPTEAWDCSNEDFSELLERNDGITSLLSEAQQDGSSCTYSPELLEDGLRFTLRVFGQKAGREKEALSYPDLWSTEVIEMEKTALGGIGSTTRHGEEIGENCLHGEEATRVVRVFFAKRLEKEPPRGRTRHRGRRLGKSTMLADISEEGERKPHYVVLGQKFSTSHNLTPPTMTHPAFRQPEVNAEDSQRDEVTRPREQARPTPESGSLCVGFRYSQMQQLAPPMMLPARANATPEMEKWFPKSTPRELPEQRLEHSKENAPHSDAWHNLQRMMKSPQRELRNTIRDHRRLIESIRSATSSKVERVGGQVRLPRIVQSEEQEDGRYQQALRPRHEVQSQCCDIFFGVGEEEDYVSAEGSVGSAGYQD